MPSESMPRVTLKALGFNMIDHASLSKGLTQCCPYASLKKREVNIMLIGTKLMKRWGTDLLGHKVLSQKRLKMWL